MLGPVLGSIAGRYIILLDWRYCFRIMTILVGLNTCAVIFGMDETYSPVLKKLYDARGGAPDAAGRLQRAQNIFRPNPEAKDVVVRTFTVSSDHCRDHRTALTSLIRAETTSHAHEPGHSAFRRL